MLKRLFTLYILTASILVFSLVYFEHPLSEKTKTNFLVYGIETDEHESEEEEHAMEEENMNIENGFSSAHSNSAEKVVNNPQVSDLSISGVTNMGSPVYGNLSAPVTLVEFGDFQCHFCGRFAKQTEPLLNSTYFQTGKVNFVPIVILFTNSNILSSRRCNYKFYYFKYNGYSSRHNN